MSKWCPAGKCECENIVSPHGYCSIPEVDAAVDVFEVCPWPSRQVGVEPPAASEKNIHPLFTSSEKFESDLNHFAKIQYDAGFAEGFAAGRAYQSGKDVDAVEKLVESHPDINVNIENGWIKLLNIIAALREAAKGE